jgi:hypothetical protein
MILLITPYLEVQRHVPAWESVMAEPIKLASNLRQATSRLRSADYSLVAADQAMLEAEPEESELMLQHIGTAMPVYLNFAISGPERVLKELRAALSRRRREDVLARQAAERALQAELKGAITAALLSCDLALEVRGLPRVAEDRIRAITNRLQEMRARLGLKESLKDSKTASVRTNKPAPAEKEAAASHA